MSSSEFPWIDCIYTLRKPPLLRHLSLNLVGEHSGRGEAPVSRNVIIGRGTRVHSHWLRLIGLAVLCAVTGAEKLTALDPSRRITQYVHSVWRIEQGLPQNSVWAILQTRDGYLWLGTEEGLARFDGVGFVVFDKRNAPALKHNWIRALVEGRDGSLWIGTDGGGLTRLKNGVYTSYTTDQGLSSNLVKAIYEDPEETLWIATPRGLNRFKDGRFTAFTTRDGLPADYIRSIAGDGDRNLWIGTIGGGLSRLRDGKFQNFTVEHGLSNNRVGALYPDDQGGLWIGTGGGGLGLFQSGRFTIWGTKEGLPSPTVFTVALDQSRSVWIGTDGGGLSRLSDGKLTTLTTKQGLSSDNVLSLYEDREGSLWIGTDAGLNRLYDGKFKTFSATEGLSKNQILSLSEDPEGGLWVGTDGGGLNRILNNEIRSLTAKEGLSDERVLSLHHARSGDLWIGTYTGGLSRLHAGKFSSFDSDSGLAGDTIYSILEDRAGSLWVGTFSGLSRYQNGGFTNFTTAEGLSNDSVRSLAEDGNGTLWIGTDHGLNRFQNGKFQVYTARQGLSDDWILSLYADPEGNLWIGTSGGLNRLRNGKITSYTTKDGLFHDVVFVILEDDKQNLWMSCNKGVYRVSKKDLLDFDQKKISRIHSDYYGAADGMKSSECNGGSQPSGLKSRDGRLWFATMQGVTVIDPQNIRTNKRPPPVHLEQVRVDHDSISLKVQELSPGKRKFEFHYSALSLIDPSRVRFKYILEGLDPSWVEAETRRAAYYTNIPPGRYTFKAIASNNDGVWNESGASYSFYLKPYFYQAGWFYALCAGVAVLAGLGAHRFRISQLNQRFGAVLAERTRIAREFHDTLAQGFSAVVMQLQAAVEIFPNDPEQSRGRMARATDLARETLEEARRSVHNLRRQMDEPKFTEIFENAILQAAAETGATIDVQILGDPVQIRSEQESQLLRVAQEAVRNATRHAHARKISARLHYTSRSVQLEIEDDGVGFDPASVASIKEGHFGLAGMRERAEIVNGEFLVSSHPGQGTQVSLKIPL